MGVKKKSLLRVLWREICLKGVTNVYNMIDDKPKVRFANVCGDLCVTFEVSQCSNLHTILNKLTNHKTVVQTHTSKPE